MPKDLIEISSREQNTKPSIAIHLHLFYPDLLDEFIAYFANIPAPFDLYISCVKGANVKEIQQRVEEHLPLLQRADVRICTNRGRDIAPFYVEFGKKLSHYQYVLHVHSKKSKHIEEGGSDWRKYSMDCLLGSREWTEEILQRFRREPDIGLIYPDYHPDVPMIGYTWLGNAASGQQLLEQMGIPFREGIFFYPAGSFFWARVDAIRPLLERGFKKRHFPSEWGQIDGTLAHVLERAITFVSEDRGYHSYIVDAAEHTMRKDYTPKPFREYFARTREKMLQELLQYESISFGVFGTLLEFAVSREEFMERICKKSGIGNKAKALRMEAEQRAKNIHGAAVSLDDIYEELMRSSVIDRKQAERLKQAEVDCLYNCLRPRDEIRDIYRELIRAGKQIVIACDTYYGKNVMETLLVRYGFVGYQRIWVSCECGTHRWYEQKRNLKYEQKRDLVYEQMWNLVYEQYDSEHHIHVGSDVYADWYTLERRGTHSMYLMSAEQARELEEKQNGCICCDSDQK